MNILVFNPERIPTGLWLGNICNLLGLQGRNSKKTFDCFSANPERFYFIAGTSVVVEVLKLDNFNRVYQQYCGAFMRLLAIALVS